MNDQGYRAQVNDCGKNDGGDMGFLRQSMTISDVGRTNSKGPDPINDPVVVLGPPSFVGGDPSTTRIRSVSTSPLDVRYFLQEWDYRDGGHTNETIGMLAVERNRHFIGRLRAQANVANVDHNWQTVTFNKSFTETPVVVAQIASFAGSQAATVRIRNVTTTSFDIRVQEEGNDGTHAVETTHWIAAEPGSTTMNGRRGPNGRYRHPYLSTINFGQSLSNPVVIADMQTFDGSDPAALRYTNLTNNSVQIKVEEEASLDAEVNHTTEVVGYIVIGQ